MLWSVRDFENWKILFCHRVVQEEGDWSAVCMRGVLSHVVDETLQDTSAVHERLGDGRESISMKATKQSFVYLAIHDRV